MFTKDNKNIIASEIDKWEKRVWFPDLGKEYDNMDIEEYNIILSKGKFKNIWTSDKDDIYRFVRYGISHGIINNTNVIFVRPSILKAYLILNINQVKAYEFIDKFLNTSEISYGNKFLVISDLDIEFDDNTCIYLQSELNARGCRGIIYNCNMKYPNNFKQCTIDTECAECFDINKI